MPWLDILRAHAVFGFRRLLVAPADHLYSMSRHGIGFDGKPSSYDSWAGLFVTTFERLTHKSTRISSELLLVLSTVTQHPQSNSFLSISGALPTGVTLFAAALPASLPAVIRAIHIDPVEALRSE